MRQVTDSVSQLQADEDFGLRPYKDSVYGVITFGYGFTFITEAESLVILKGRIQSIHDALIATLPWTASLSQPRFGVLLNMAYNLGVIGLLDWKTFLELVESGEYTEAANDLEHNNPKYVAEVGDRAHRLAEQMRTDQWV